ncbi:MAG: carboxypeptidase regulatory-like domain-containing protein, partial [Woeseiaceae bacterium]
MLLKRLGMVSLAVLALLALPVAGFAQTTTSSIQGLVVDPQGAAVAGAEIAIVHVATGMTSTTRTNSTGAYELRGLRVGGPYVATLHRSTQYGEERIEDIYILLSEPYVLNLETRTTAIEEVVVHASEQDVFLRIGAASNFDSHNIAGQANVDRDFKNVITQDPRVIIDHAFNNAISIAGMNNRTNSLTVDGVRQNDDFGLNASGFPTQRAPVSIDAIEQITVQIAPFDVTFGGFTGGTINAVTKSGTNDWGGSFTVMHSDDGLLGDKSETDNVDVGDFDEDTLAATLSGPILKNRLWFFASYEEWTASDTSALAYGPAGSGRDNEIAQVTQADIDEVSRIARDTYGFEPGVLPDSGQDVKSETFLLKLDWAISDKHTVSVTYQDVIGNEINAIGSWSAGNRLGLPSNWFDRSEDFQSLSGQLFSSWTDAFSTEIKIASQERTTGQNSLHGSEMAQMDIGTAGGGTIRLGSDVFRHDNGVQNDQFQWKIKGDYLWQNHTIT